MIRIGSRNISFFSCSRGADRLSRALARSARTERLPLSALRTPSYAQLFVALHSPVRLVRAAVEKNCSHHARPAFLDTAALAATRLRSNPPLSPPASVPFCRRGSPRAPARERLALDMEMVSTPAEAAHSFRSGRAHSHHAARQGAENSTALDRVQRIGGAPRRSEKSQRATCAARSAHERRLEMDQRS